MKYDYIVVGAGLAGGILARKLAESGKRILIVERRNHIAGNTYDFTDANGIKVQKYGPMCCIRIVTSYINSLRSSASRLRTGQSVRR